MVKVITYGTYDLLHYGHIRLLERAKALGDYLIVGVTTEDFDKKRGKINVQQSLMERIANVRALNIADEIIVEEYEGQKIDDIRRYDVDVFTVGSDWIGKFDYLAEYCQVIYLPRTEGISSTNIRTENLKIRMGFVGDSSAIKKFILESRFVNGIEPIGICSANKEKNFLSNLGLNDFYLDEQFDAFIEKVDALYIQSNPQKHYEQIKSSLLNHKHVICESPISLKEFQCRELFRLAQKHQCVLMEGIKTAYSTAYTRLILLIKSGKIGKVVSVDATCTSMRNLENTKNLQNQWNSMCAWGTIALLPVFQILGTNYKSKSIVSHYLDPEKTFDGFTNINFIYDNAVASIRVAKSAKSEGELIVTGTKGYIYVPAPWWKTDYFEVRYENIEDNRRYFYQLDGEGIRYEFLSFSKAIEGRKNTNYIHEEVSVAIARVLEAFYNKEDLIEI